MYIKSVKQKGKLSNKSKIHLILLEKEKTLRKPYFIGTQNLQDTNTEVKKLKITKKEKVGYIMPITKCFLRFG